MSGNADIDISNPNRVYECKVRLQRVDSLEDAHIIVKNLLSDIRTGRVTIPYSADEEDQLVLKTLLDDNDLVEIGEVVMSKTRLETANSDDGFDDATIGDDDNAEE